MFGINDGHVNRDKIEKRILGVSRQTIEVEGDVPSGVVHVNLVELDAL